MLAVLSPSTRSLDPVFLEQLQGAVRGGAAVAREPVDRVASDGRSDRKRDHAVRRDLCRFPAPRGEGVEAPSQSDIGAAYAVVGEQSFAAAADDDAAILQHVGAMGERQ